jgi:hypothetical protein
MAGFNPADYETVDSRIHRFYDQFPDGRIITELVEIYRDDNGRPIQYIFKAYAYRDRDIAQPDATGYAEETVSVSTAPKSSLLETGETSAIGRCLSNLGLSAKGKRPSQTEMEKAARYEDRPIKKAAARISPTDDYVDAAALKLRANALNPEQKKQLLEAWPAKLVKPIPDRIPPTVAHQLDQVLTSIESGDEPAAAGCDKCGNATRCPLAPALQVDDPQCAHYMGEE